MFVLQGKRQRRSQIGTSCKSSAEVHPDVTECIQPISWPESTAFSLQSTASHPRSISGSSLRHNGEAYSHSCWSETWWTALVDLLCISPSSGSRAPKSHDTDALWRRILGLAKSSTRRRSLSCKPSRITFLEYGCFSLYNPVELVHMPIAAAMSFQPGGVIAWCVEPIELRSGHAPGA